MLLAGDLGGTKTILALFANDGDARNPIHQRRYASKDYPSLTRMLDAFLSEQNADIDAASFAVAGPVIAGKADVTNLSWVISEEGLRARLGDIPVQLINDLQATAYAIPALTPDDLHALHPGVAEPEGAIAVIAPGTGLGEAYLVWDGTQYRAYASEGGHTDFAPRNELEMALLRYLLQRMDHVSYERVCSGVGVPNLYAYLKESGYAPEPPWLARQLQHADDPTPVIMTAALQTSPPCALCSATLDLFVSILGAEAGNLALKVLSTGGVYLAGGIPPRILEALRHGQFMQSFIRKGRFADRLIRMPVNVVLNPNTAIIGAARYGFDLLKEAGM
jgi:glucokinase